MSADNGYILRRNEDNKFVLQMFFASWDEYPPIDSPHVKTFETIEEAVLMFDRLSHSDYPPEYGLWVDLAEITPNPTEGESDGKLQAKILR